MKIFLSKAKTDISLLGTGLKIKKGSILTAIKANNIPNGGWFIRPNSIKKNPSFKFASEDDSIYISPNDNCISEPKPLIVKYKK